MPDPTTSLSDEALLGKAREFIARGLRAKTAGQESEYQLWASLSLELLGKAVLATVHPCLIADPQSNQSLFAAAGRPIGTDIRTIAAKTLYERLARIVEDFGSELQTFCLAMSERRNAELHSGEAAFEGVPREHWEARFWHAMQVLSFDLGLDLDDLIGVADAKAPKDLVEHALEAQRQAAAMRVEQAAKEFAKRPNAERKALLEQAKRGSWRSNYMYFENGWDHLWAEDCPACGAQAYLGGSVYQEEPLDVQSDPDHPYTEYVEVRCFAEEFHCGVCGLALRGRAEISAAGIEEEARFEEKRERVWEPDYGNE